MKHHLILGILLLFTAQLSQLFGMEFKEFKQSWWLSGKIRSVMELRDHRLQLSLKNISDRPVSVSSLLSNPDYLLESVRIEFSDAKSVEVYKLGGNGLPGSPGSSVRVVRQIELMPGQSLEVNINLLDALAATKNSDLQKRLRSDQPRARLSILHDLSQVGNGEGILSYTTPWMDAK